MLWKQRKAIKQKKIHWQILGRFLILKFRTHQIQIALQIVLSSELIKYSSIRALRCSELSDDQTHSNRAITATAVHSRFGSLRSCRRCCSWTDHALFFNRNRPVYRNKIFSFCVWFRRIRKQLRRDKSGKLDFRTLESSFPRLFLQLSLFCSPSGASHLNLNARGHRCFTNLVSSRFFEN